MLAMQIAHNQEDYLNKAMSQEITADTPVNIRLLQTNSNANIGVRFIEQESQFAMDPSLAERTNNLMDANEYRQMHP
jgi:hypothetical protein